MKVTISGSYRKYPEEIANTLQEFQDNGAQVLSPPSLDIITEINGFVSVKGDLVERLQHQTDISSAMQALENSHLRAMLQSDLLWLTLPENYLGPATAFEIGFAIAHNIPIYTKNIQTDPLVQMYVNTTPSISYLVQNFDPTKTMKINPDMGRSIMKQTGYNSTIAVGAIALDPKGNLVLVNDGHWDNQYTLPGVKRKPGEQLTTTLTRAVQQRLNTTGIPGKQIALFEELHTEKFEERVFADYIIHLDTKPTKPNTIILPASKALTEILIEPNARETIKLYLAA